jgi:hypothetical protein
MDWFENLTGFPEIGYASTQAQLEVKGNQLKSLVNGASYGIGRFDVASLQAIRERAQSSSAPKGQPKISVAIGDVRGMHRSPANEKALFQVASQFNMLEMSGPSVTPEDGVAGYCYDHTQGPACAMAAGAATIYRNYFVPVGGAQGQTADRQLDGLRSVGEMLSSGLKVPIGELWTMKNGYALANQDGLEIISRYLSTLDHARLDVLRCRLGIGLHRDVEVTEGAGSRRPVVSQAFCSALPVAYCDVPKRYWEAFATLILEAAYEATMWAAVENAQRGASNVVFLTLLGGGAFGNDENWIHAAIRRALKMVAAYDLDVRLVCYSSPSASVRRLVRELE